jgi:hypothetical protein
MSIFLPVLLALITARLLDWLLGTAIPTYRGSLLQIIVFAIKNRRGR